MGQVVDASMMFMNRVRMWMAGVSFHGRRDLYEQFGYKRIVDYRDFLATYHRQGLAKRIIDQPVLSTWGDPPQITTDDDRWNEAWEAIVEENTLWHHIIRLDKLAGLGRFAVMVIGYDDGQKLDRPIKQASGDQITRSVLYFQPYHEHACSILEYEKDTSSPRYGLPTMYNINPGRLVADGLQTSMSQGLNSLEIRQPFNIHYTRIVHVAENLLEDRIFGTSRLEAIFNDLNDMLKLSGSSAETFWLIANRGMQINVDKDMDLSPEDAKELQQEVDDYQHQLRRFIRTRGVEVKTLGHDGVDPTGVFNLLMSMITAGTGIPSNVLVGNGGRQLEAELDRANWSDRIAERVVEYAEPVILKGLLDNFIYAGALTIPQNIQISWPEAFKMSPLERAQTSAQMARSAVNLTKAAQLSNNNTQGITGQDASIQKPSDDNEDPNTINDDPNGETNQTPQRAGNTPIDPQGQQVQAPSKPLFSHEEMRRMVSFGKHPPVFDSPTPQGDTPSPGSPPPSKSK